MTSSVLLTSVGYANDGELRKRIRMASVQTALAVQGEAPASQTPEALVKRAALAARVLASAGGGGAGDDLGTAFVWAVVSGALVTPQSTDSDIQFTVNSVFSDLAGVTGAEILNP